MKSPREGFTLGILFLIFVQAASGTAGTTITPLPKSGGEPTAVEPQKPSSDSEENSSSAPPLLKDVVRASENSPGKYISCPDVMPQRYKSFCTGAGESKSSLRLDKDSNFKMSYFMEPSTRLHADLMVIPSPEPSQAERRRSAYQIWQGLDMNKVAKFFSWEEKTDYFIIVKEATVGSHLALPQPKVHLAKKTREIHPGASHLILDLLEWLHKTGFVAINFYLAKGGCLDAVCPEKLDGLHFLARVGEPVGKLPFDPVLTDPAILGSDGTLPADPAADYYAFGIHLMLEVLSSEMKVQDHTKKSVLYMKKNSKFVFPAGTSVNTALFVCFLLQNDRVARSNLPVLSNLFFKMIENQEGKVLEQEITYDPKEDPLTLPQFQLTDETATSSVVHGRTPAWLIPTIAGAILLLIVIIYFACRKGSADRGDPVDVDKELNQPSQTEP